MFPIPGKNFGLLLAVALCLGSLAAPAAATLVLARVTLAPPDLPLAPGQGITADTGIAIIPSGAKTFATDHSLQMQTDLLEARWNTVVLTDGIPSHTESDEGSVTFINGFVLSYPTNRDVSLEVTVSGTVPAGVSSVTVLNVQELGNTGDAVPGSTVTITEPVSVPATPTTKPAATVTLPPPSPSPSPAPTRAGGDAWAAALAVAGTMGLARIRPGHRRRP